MLLAYAADQFDLPLLILERVPPPRVVRSAPLRLVTRPGLPTVPTTLPTSRERHLLSATCYCSGTATVLVQYEYSTVQYLFCI